MRIVAHLSDLHFGRHEPAVVEALLANLRAAAPDLVVVSGDLTQRARRREFAAARAFLDRIEAPTLVVPGNHDIPFYHPLKRLWQPLTRFRRFITPLRMPVYVDDEIAVLGINTARRLTVKNGRISFTQMAEIRRIFGGLPADLFKVLVTHHPFAAPPTDRVLDPVGRWRPALDAVADAGVHLLLSGHFHHSFSGDLATRVVAARCSVLMVHAGTAISTRLRDEANAYNLLRFEDGGLSVAVMGWAGEGFAELRRQSYDLRGGRWLPAGDVEGRD